MRLYIYTTLYIVLNSPLCYTYSTFSTLLFLYLSFHFVSVLNHSLFISSLCSHLDDFYRAKVVTAENTENTSPLLAENFS